MLTVVFTSLFILSNQRESRISSFAQRSKLLALLGRMSLSIFLWHQPLFAFYRYFFADELSCAVLFGITVLTLLISAFTYYIIEKKVCISRASRICLLIAFLSVNAFALRIYQQGGVVRDVPELDIRKGESDPAAFERYTDRIYQYDREFSPDSTRHKILIIGNSFARDFANILLESSFADSIQLSYRVGFGICPMSRICQADRIYFFGWKHDVPDIVWHNLKLGTEVWGIGTKNHGSSNGIFYKNRHRSNYFAQRTTINPDYYAVNRLLREEWEGHYVDLLGLVSQQDSSVTVFTPNHHFITYDGGHLTPSGTRYYATLLNMRLPY
jgi:hypothetical protein